MYRVKSNAVWHSLPGVVAAYQPIAAPDSLAARQNVAHSGARFGVYTATPGVLPTWSAATGHSYDGVAQYLNTQITPVNNQTWSALVRFAQCASGNKFIFGGGGLAGGFRAFGIEANRLDNAVLYGNGGIYYPSPAMVFGVLGLSGNKGYRNGVVESGTIPSATGVFYPLFFGAVNYDGVPYPGTYLAVSVQSVLIASRTLTSAEMWLASRQMAYCEQNPDWNAWARRRRYYYAPSAAFQAAWAARTNRLIGGGL